MDIEIKANVNELLDHLKANRKAHVADYKKAVRVYKADLRDAVTELGKKARSAAFLDHSYSVSLRKPELKLVEYNKHIAMLEMSTEDTIVIGSDEFDCIVNDNWHWLQAAKLVNFSYSSKLGG